MFRLIIRYAIAMSIFSCCAVVSGQEITQTIRGSIVDLETHIPLFASTVAVYEDSTMIDATISDNNGYFRIDGIPVGRYTIVATYMGYRQETIPDVVVNSSKEVVLEM